MEQKYFDDELVNFFNKYNIPLKDKDGYYRPVVDLITELSERVYKSEEENKNEK